MQVSSRTPLYEVSSPVAEWHVEDEHIEVNVDENNSPGRNPTGTNDFLSVLTELAWNRDCGYRISFWWKFVQLGLRVTAVKLNHRAIIKQQSCRHQYSRHHIPQVKAGNII